MWKADGSLDRATLRVRIDSLVKGFDESFFYERRQRAERADPPVLIVGLALAATRRCEQVLATHLTLRVDVLQLGFVALRFPDARVLHCTRPLANDTPASDASDASFLHREHQRLMAHWCRVLPLPIHELRFPEAR